MTEATDIRLSMLEQGQEKLEQGQTRIENKIDNLGEAMSLLVRLEERHMLTQQRLAEGAAKMGDLDKRMAVVEHNIPDKLTERLGIIEVTMPGLKELRKWVISGVLGGLAMMGSAVAHLILK